MKLGKNAKRVAISVGITAGMFSLGTLLKQLYPSYKDDNFAEEMVEELVDTHTGVDVDITPTSPEKK